MVDAVVFVVVDAGWCLSWYVVCVVCCVVWLMRCNLWCASLYFECSVVFRCVVVCVVGCRDVYFAVRSPVFLRCAPLSCVYLAVCFARIGVVCWCVL